MSRTVCLLALLIYLLTVPAGAYVLLAVPGSGYLTKMGGLVVVVLALAGLALLPIVERKRTKAADSLLKSTDKKSTGSE